MSKKTKTIIVLLVILFFTCSCISSFIAGAGTYLLFNSLFKRAPEITNGILYDICSSHGNFPQSQYENWFTYNYRETTNYSETKDLVSEIFDNTYDCNELKLSHFIQMLFKGQSFETNTSVAGTTATISIPINGESASFNLIYTQDEWKISSVSTSKYFGY